MLRFTTFGGFSPGGKGPCTSLLTPTASFCAPVDTLRISLADCGRLGAAAAAAANPAFRFEQRREDKYGVYDLGCCTVET